MTTTMTYAEVSALLHRAVCALASVCDHAESQDDQGFNGGDAHFGHSIAAMDPARMSPRQMFCVAKMLRKYTKQLLRRGIDLSELPDLSRDEVIRQLPRPQPVTATSGQPVSNGRSVEALPDGYYKVIFPYDNDLVNAIKALHYKCRVFQSTSTGKYWLVNFNDFSAEVWWMKTPPFASHKCRYFK